MNANRIKTFLCLALAALALCVPAAVAEATWVIKGRGFGHGIGLSQWGMQGFAKNGKKYKAILRHYYRGTKVRRTKPKRVRVLLASTSRITFSGAKKACGRRVSPTRRYSFLTSSGKVVLFSAKGRRIASCGSQGRAGSGLEIAGLGSYRGALVAVPGSGGLLAINALGVEGYVKGVVANEIPSSWHPQALRGQAVAARSYALATGHRGPFDHYADTRSQVYGGKSSETKRTNRAVKKTKRRVVKYRGKIAVTYFSSTSGGQTESVEYGFPGAAPVPYLRSVNDPYDRISPVHTWRVTMSDGQMESALRGLYQGDLEAIKVTERGDSPRIVRARVVGSSGSSPVSGPTLRARLGLRSTWASFEHK